MFWFASLAPLVFVDANMVKTKKNEVERKQLKVGDFWPYYVCSLHVSSKMFFDIIIAIQVRSKHIEEDSQIT